MGEKRFRVETQPGAQPGQRILRPVGPVNFETVPTFLRAVRDELAPAIILDLTGVPYMDSGGVGALVQSYGWLHKKQRRLVLAGVSPRVMAVLEITRVHKLFDVFHSVGEAEEYLASGR